MGVTHTQTQFQAQTHCQIITRQASPLSYVWSKWLKGHPFVRYVQQRMEHWWIAQSSFSGWVLDGHEGIGRKPCLASHQITFRRTVSVCSGFSVLNFPIETHQNHWVNQKKYANCPCFPLVLAVGYVPCPILPLARQVETWLLQAVQAPFCRNWSPTGSAVLQTTTASVKKYALLVVATSSWTQRFSAPCSIQSSPGTGQRRHVKNTSPLRQTVQHGITCCCNRFPWS